MFDVVGGIATWLSICYPGNRCFRQDGTKDHLGSSCNETYTLASAFDHRSQLQNSSAQLRWGRSQDVVYWDSMGTDALHQGLATGAIGCIPTECQVRGDHLFYRAMHPYGMPGVAIGSCVAGGTTDSNSAMAARPAFAHARECSGCAGSSPPSPRRNRGASEASKS